MVDTVIELLNTEAELIETGQAPNGSATNVNLIIHDLLPNLAQERLQPTTNRHQLLEKNWELCLLADLLKGTQKEYNVVDKSLSDLEEENEVCSLKLLHTCIQAGIVQLSHMCALSAYYSAARLQSWMCKPLLMSCACAFGCGAAGPQLTFSAECMPDRCEMPITALSCVCNGRASDALSVLMVSAAEEGHRDFCIG